MNRANKVEKNLSAEQLQAFIKELAEDSANPTLASIQAHAEKYGIAISHEAARTFKKNNFQGYLDKISGAKERAEVLANAITGQEEGDIAAGVGILITEQITELLISDKEDGWSPKDMELLSKAVNLLRSSDQAERKTKLDIEKKEIELKALRAQNEQAKEVTQSKLTPEEKEAKYKEIFGIAS